MSAAFFSIQRPTHPQQPVRCSEPMYFVYPTASLQERSTPELPLTTTVRGNIVLDVAKPKSFDHLKLFYRIWFECYLMGKTEKALLREYTIDLLDGQERHFSPGQYTIPWSVEEHCTNPGKDPTGYIPTYHMDYRVSRHHLLELYSSKGGKRYREEFLSSGAPPGTVRHGTVWPSGSRCLVTPSWLPMGEMPSALTLMIEEHVDICGAFRMLATSRNFQVGGLLHIQFVLCSVPEELHVLYFNGSIVERRYFAPPLALSHLSAHDTSRSVVLFNQTPSVQGQSLKMIRPNEEVTFEAECRLPDDETCSAATHPLTESPLKITHALVVEVAIRTTAGIGRLIRIARDVDLAECTIIPENMALPQYSLEKQKLASQETSQPQRKSDPWWCCCGLTTEMLRSQGENPNPPLSWSMPNSSKASSSTSSASISNGNEMP